MAAPNEQRRTWSRFRRNRPAVVALVYIAATVGIAIFGYWLAPDNSPDANIQTPEIALQPPGFQVEVIPLRLDREIPDQSSLSILLHGKIPAARWIPVEPGSMQVDQDSIRFQRYGRATSPEALARLVTAGNTLQLRHYPLGTDKYGRCVLSRLLLGFRVSLLVGCIAVAISLTLGLLLGLLGGYFGGRVDDAVMLLVNTVWSIPTLLLVFVIVLALGRGVGIIFLAVGLTMWVEVARVVRGQVIALRDMPFVEAARSLGLGSARILGRHILPNLLGPVLVVAAGNFATAILLESGLSYLGFGVQPPAPSWGTMLNDNYGYALSGKPLLALAPAAAIALTVLAFNLVGNGLRDALDVRNRA
ncbi:MAG: ABC transporter permease [Saprospiraceae bacterium]